MPTVFPGRPGRVVVLQDDAAAAVLPPLVTVDPSLSFASRRALVTRVTVDEQTSHQFAHTLGGLVYLYVFGDRIGQMTISGLAVATCGFSGGGEHGLVQSMRWYRENKLSRRQTPVRVLIETFPITGFVTGFNADVVDHRLNLAQFTMQMAVLPER